MRLRFSIRDLLWLTLVVAVLVAWWFNRQHLLRECSDERNSHDVYVKKLRELNPILTLPPTTMHDVEERPATF
jgi:hypothetical protein